MSREMLTRGYAIAYDVTDPTPWEEDDPDVLYDNHNPVICPYCGKEIRMGDDVVHCTVDHAKKYIHESCLDRECPGYEDLFGALGIDYTTDSGAWFADRM